MSVSRPLGVTILALLAALGGIGGILMGVSILTYGGYYNLIMEVMPPEVPAAATGLIEAILMGVAVVSIITGLIDFILAYGLWKGKGWARILTIIFSALGIIMGLLSLPMGIVGVLIGALIIYYLTRPHVKDFFKGTSLPQTPS